MRILLTRLTNDRHSLEVLRDDGSREVAILETRSYFVHDLLHYAVESSAGLREGFWGALARGSTLAELNDRTSDIAMGNPNTAMIELAAGVLSGALKGRTPAELVAGLGNYLEATGKEMPPWFTEAFVADVQERMRRLLGHWKATRFGEAMELHWKG